MEPFSVSFSISKNDYVKVILNKSYRKPFMIVFTVLGFYFFIRTIAILLNLNRSTGSEQERVFQGIWGITTFVSPILTYRWAAKNYAAAKVLHVPNTFTFSDEGVSSDSSLTNGLIKWEGIVKRQEIGDYLLLYTDRVVAMFLKKD
jgi:hypothetical protein